MAISSRDDLLNYAYRRLGSPVVQINVDRQQAEDRINEALELFTERHFDGVERAFFRYQITADDINNKYISTSAFGPVNGPMGDAPTGNNIVSVIRVFQFGDFANINMFDIRYQLALSDYFGINRGLGSSTSLGLAGYSSTRNHLSLIQDLFSPEKQIRFNKVSNRLHIDGDWGSDLTAGEYITIEAYVSLDPTIFTEIFNDRLLKEYVTALIKLQWGQNMSKFAGVQLPGGVSLRGPELVAEAKQEIQEIYLKFQDEFELPIDFMVG